MSEKLGICTAALFFTFVTDLVAVRLGKEYLAKHGISTDHQVQVSQGLQVLASQQPVRPGSSSARRETCTIGEGGGSSEAGDVERASTISSTMARPEGNRSVSMTTMPADTKVAAGDYWSDQSENTPPGAQILGVAILEFGILFHSVSSSFSLPTPVISGGRWLK